MLNTPEGLLGGIEREREWIDAVELLKVPYEPPRFIVDHLVPEQSVVLFTGDSGAGKTAFLTHAAVAVAADLPIAARFATVRGARVLYVNGEMESADMRRYLREAAAGLRVEVTPRRLIFEGADACATFSVGGILSSALLRVIDEVAPHVVIFDTMRALLVRDEREAAEVREVFGWIRRHVVREYGATALIGHHLRKLTQVSNSARQRTSGSSDIIASVDVHFAAKNREGRPLHAILLDKTRVPTEGCTAGTEWPIEARLEAGPEGYRSIFAAGEPARIAEGGKALEDAVDDLRDRLVASGPMTIAQLGARTGSAKRAYEQMRQSGELIEVGKAGRAALFDLANGVNERGQEFGF